MVKNWRRRKRITKIEYLENEKNFLGDYKAFFIYFKDLLLLKCKKIADINFDKNC